MTDATVYYHNRSLTRAIVKIVGAASADTATINLNDVVQVGQSGFSGVSGSGYSGFSGYRSRLNITQLAWSCDATGVITIVRNNLLVYKLFGSGMMPYGSTEFHDYPLVVTFTGTAGGTLVLELSKADGYSPVSGLAAYGSGGAV
jgi:hypothetical protein